MVTCTLEECRNVEAHIVEAQSDTVLEGCVCISEDLAVTWLVYCVRTEAELSVTIKVNILEVTGKPTTCKTLCNVAEVYFLCISLRLSVSLEETVCHEAPDLTELHTLVVVLSEGSLRVVVLGDDGLVVTYVSRDAVAERLSTEVDLISPAE